MMRRRLIPLACLFLIVLVSGGRAVEKKKGKNGTEEENSASSSESPSLGTDLESELEGGDGGGGDVAFQILTPPVMAQKSQAAVVVRNSRELRNAVENPRVNLILLASDMSLRRDVWPEVPRELPELSLVVGRNLTITSHPKLPATALLDLDFMVNRITAGSGVTITINRIAMAGVTRDPLSYLTVPFFQFKPQGVVLLENCQYQIAIAPSRLGPLSIYPSKIASTARPEGYEDWKVKMKVVSRTECPHNIVREAPCNEGALWVGSLSARATVFDWEYKPLGKAAFLLKNVFMVAVNLDKERPATSEELLPGAKTVTVTNSEDLRAGFLDQNVSLIYVANHIIVDEKIFPNEAQLEVSRNVSIASHPGLQKPASIDLQYAQNVVTAGVGTMISIHNLHFSNTSTKSETYELIPFFQFSPDSVFMYRNVVSEMAISARIDKLTQLPFVLYGGHPPKGFNFKENHVAAVDSEWCESEKGIECPTGALYIKEGVRRVQVLDQEAESFLGNGFIVAKNFLVLAKEAGKFPVSSTGGKPSAGVLKAVRNSTGLSSSRSENALQASGQGGDTEDKKGGLKLTIIVYVLAGTLIIIAALLIAIIWLWKGNRKKSTHHVDSKDSAAVSVGEELMLEHQHVAQQLLGDVKLGALLGWGSFGRVYKGLWGGAQVAVKIILHQAMGAELDEVEQEANFSVTLRHPNVVQTFHYATRSIQVDPEAVGCGTGQSPPGLTPKKSGSSSIREPSSQSKAGMASASRGKIMDPIGSQHGAAGMNLPTNWIASQVKSRLTDSANTRNSKIQSWYSNSNLAASPAMTPNMLSGVVHEAWKETWLVQEYCELGSLGKQNILRANKLPSAWGFGEPDMLAIIQSCMDIARGMKYLHDNNVVHGDLKCDNVLLQRAAATQRGFLAKVADFGLSRQLQQTGAHMSTKSYGTITHMPPELLLNGHLSTKVDVYSFAIIMWELVSGEPPFKTLRHAEVMRTVVVDNARPKFAFGTPREYVALAEKCWDRDPNIRPSFNGVLAELGSMSQVEEERAASRASAYSPSPGPHSYDHSSRPVGVGSRQSPYTGSSSYQTSDYSYQHNMGSI